MKRTTLWIIALCVACGSKTRGASRVAEATDADLADCAFVQKVQGTADNSDSNAEGTAKRKAKEQAASVGATHIKWIVPCCTYVEAEAYRCDVPDDP